MPISGQVAVREPGYIVASEYVILMKPLLHCYNPEYVYSWFEHTRTVVSTKSAHVIHVQTANGLRAE